MPTEDRQDEITSPLCLGDPLARQLATLEPRPTGPNRDALMFAAGSADRDRDTAFWRRLCYAQGAVFSLLFGVGVLSLSGRPGPGPMTNTMTANGPTPLPEAGPTDMVVPRPPAPRVADVFEPVSPVLTPDPIARAKFLQLRADVLAGGLGLLPSTPPARPVVGPSEESLRLPRGVLAAPHYQPRKPVDPDTE